LRGIAVLALLLLPLQYVCFGFMGQEGSKIKRWDGHPVGCLHKEKWTDRGHAEQSMLALVVEVEVDWKLSVDSYGAR
jgi:hypothetical protein